MSRSRVRRQCTLVKLALCIVWLRRYPVLISCLTSSTPIARKKGLLNLLFCLKEAVFGSADHGEKRKIETKLYALVRRARCCLREGAQEVVEGFCGRKGGNLLSVAAES